MGVRAAWSGADPQLLADIRFLAGYRRPALIEAGLIPGVLDAAAGQSSAGAIERAMSPRYPPLLVRPVVAPAVDGQDTRRPGAAAVRRHAGDLDGS
jgi:hypothetical protein